MAGLATHPSAEPDTLVVRAGFKERQALMDNERIVPEEMRA